MNIFLLLLIFVSFKQTFSFNKRKNHFPTFYRPLILFDKKQDNPFYNNNNKYLTIIGQKIEKIKEKSYVLWKMTRPENIMPTFLLSFSGAWISNPYLSLFRSSQFIYSSIITVLVMSAGMVINDIYDIEIDKINNNERPLAKGELTKKEAILFTIVLISTIEYLNLFFLTNNNQLIIHSVLFTLLFYTPLFKKMLFIKNMFCAFIVSFSLFFSSLASSHSLIETNKNFNILSVTMNMLFLGSWYNELLLDMNDREGDQTNKIITVPVLFGNNFAWFFSHLLLTYNTYSNVLSFYYLFGLPKALILFIIFLPLYKNSYKIKVNSYDKKIIRNGVYDTNKTLILLLFYVCSLSTF